MCHVSRHVPTCTCPAGLTGDPFFQCREIPTTPPSRQNEYPCSPSPCGANSNCRDNLGQAVCTCQPSYLGTPPHCRPECVVNSECPLDRACINNKCSDVCEHTCGIGAVCHANNHSPICACPSGFSGDPFTQCSRTRKYLQITCCLYQLCSNSINDSQILWIWPKFSHFDSNFARFTQILPILLKFVNFAGLPSIFSEMSLILPILHPRITAIIHDPLPTERPPSCVPSPCGPNSRCQMISGNPACSCLEDFIGAPPSCRPECVLNSECPSQQACIQQKCKDPCPGSCGFEASCHVLNHVPICTCNEGYEGDPFTQCQPMVVAEDTPIARDPCNPSPCGPNTDCFNGECRCVAEYQGNPYEGCRPECSTNAECSRDKACLRSKCVNPCIGTCGQSALCEVVNHLPVCSCSVGYTGDPFTNCRIAEVIPEPKRDVCTPSPCGSNSRCRDVSDHAVCSCLPGYIGSPPQCRPECVLSSECAATHACVNQKCVDPCAGACGISARCEVFNHSPICSCKPGESGDPFKSCQPIAVQPAERDETPRDPCHPTPCGPNSLCKAVGETPTCQCVLGYIGSPPSCRPECVINADCPSQSACINNKCQDPCPGSCGRNAECHIISHTVSCTCPPSFTGNAFVECVIRQDEEINPCEPSPCGSNAECLERNGVGSCRCIEDYQGNPYEGCRPECVLSSDCPADKACIRNRCKDPCPGVCGLNAECLAVNHVPTCICRNGFTGDPFTSCQLQRDEPITQVTVIDVCRPSPCGPNSRCHERNSVAVCSCIDEYFGSPPNCKPECTVNAECPSNKACHKFKCSNPCVGTCGIGAGELKLGT